MPTNTRSGKGTTRKSGRGGGKGSNSKERNEIPHQIHNHRTAMTLAIRTHRRITTRSTPETTIHKPVILLTLQTWISATPQSSNSTNSQSSNSTNSQPSNSPTKQINFATPNTNNPPTNPTNPISNLLSNSPSSSNGSAATSTRARPTENSS